MPKRFCYNNGVTKTEYVLGINAGSSSLKVSIAPFEVQDSSESPSSVYSVAVTNSGNYNDTLAEAASRLALQVPDFSLYDVKGIGHRIVHGGLQPNTARPIDDTVIEDIKRFAYLDPEHAPAALEFISVLQNHLPDTPQFACFDTAFFHDIPRVAQITTFPRRYEAQGLRRYGFHGLSYSYLLEDIIRRYPEAAHEKIVFAHLGGGASLAAVSQGKPIDMTMGFSPTSGIIMSSRTGNVDPSIFSFLSNLEGINADDWTRITNHESGLLGVSELSSDMYTLVMNEDSNPQAKEAVELFVYQVQKAIGELSAALGGIDRIVFSGGIGEKSAILRSRIVDKLGYLGFFIDETVNQSFNGEHYPESRLSDWSRKPINVIATDENAIIIKHVQSLLSNQDQQTK
jgi:acetate kinase